MISRKRGSGARCSSSRTAVVTSLWSLMIKGTLLCGAHQTRFRRPGKAPPSPQGPGERNGMKIVKIENLHADGGWRNFSFLKLVTDEGLVGWSEYAETSWSPC